MQEKTIDLKGFAISGALFETTSRYGSAGSEFLKGLRGIDYQTGQEFDRSLLDIKSYKINVDHANQNIKQQAGFSAEIASVSRRNAKSIINKSNSHFTRSEDLAHYGKNHNVVDIVELFDDQEITSQMKFVTNSESLVDKIAAGSGSGKSDYSRYMAVDKLEVPTEQVKEMKTYCRTQVEKLNKQVMALEQQGKSELAKKYRQNIENYKKLEGKIADSGLTTDQAIKYRLNPEWETILDITEVSHQAGSEGAKLGAVIGGSISLISNIIAVYSNQKDFSDAAIDVAQDTLVAAGVGYGTAFVGTAAKTYMQQSTSSTLRSLSATGLPATIMTTCLATGKSVNRYANGEIDGTELLQEMHLTVSGTLSASMFTMIGQLAIPVPVLGGLIGGMIGYALTNTFYQSFFDVLKEAKLSAEQRVITEMKCKAAKELSYAYQKRINKIFTEKLSQLDQDSRAMFAILDNPDISADDFCVGINKFAQSLGKELSINSFDEFDQMMLSDEPFKI